MNFKKYFLNFLKPNLFQWYEKLKFKFKNKIIF